VVFYVWLLGKCGKRERIGLLNCGLLNCGLLNCSVGYSESVGKHFESWAFDFSRAEAAKLP
jgi:hypothetical protein